MVKRRLIPSAFCPYNLSSYHSNFKLRLGLRHAQFRLGPPLSSSKLRKYCQTRVNICRVIQLSTAVDDQSIGSNRRPWKAHPQVDVQSTDRFNFSLSQIERGAVQIGSQPTCCVCLGNDRNASLRRPAQKNLARFCSCLQFLSHATGGVTHPFHGP
jgi:hypothetical protein